MKALHALKIRLPQIISIVNSVFLKTKLFYKIRITYTKKCVTILVEGKMDNITVESIKADILYIEKSMGTEADRTLKYVEALNRVLRFSKETIKLIHEVPIIPETIEVRRPIGFTLE